MRRRYLITGRVQGVGYRYFTRRIGIRLGLAGWVRNLQSGEVEVEAQGTADELGAFELELRRGPPGALVAGFNAAEVSDEPDVANSFVVA